MTDGTWPSGITEILDEGVRLRGTPLEEQAASGSFASTIWLLFTGEQASTEVERVVDAILILSIDHGPGSPSALTTRTVVSGNGDPAIGAAAGLLAMGEFHGPATASLALLREVGVDGDVDVAAREAVIRLCADGRRVPGFGHRRHRTGDRRVAFLLDLAREVGLDAYFDTSQAIQRALEDATGRALPMNLDGAIATVLAPTSISPALAGALFTVSRFAGLNAQGWEESTREKPMRVIDPAAWHYDGPDGSSARS
jgi:citrate synthase